MFGKIGIPELILILVIALVVFGPSKLPEVGESLGRAIREFKKSVDLGDDDESKESDESSESTKETKSTEK